MLLFMQHKRRHEPRQPSEVWQAFGRLFLPKWDRDFLRRTLWKKLPVGTRMERLGGKLCLLDGRVESHEHVFRHCMFSTFMQSTVRKAFRMVDAGGVKVERSRLLRDFPLLSITTTQGCCCGRVSRHSVTYVAGQSTNTSQQRWMNSLQGGRGFCGARAPSPTWQRRDVTCSYLLRSWMGGLTTQRCQGFSRDPPSNQQRSVEGRRWTGNN